MGAGCTDEVIPDEVIKNCWRKAGILSFEVNQLEVHRGQGEGQ